MSVFAKRLKAARKASGLSQEKLGREAGIDENTASARMNQYERGVHVPDVSIVEKIAKVLHRPTSYFYEKDDEIAAMLIHFHKLTKKERQTVLKFIAELSKGSN